MDPKQFDDVLRRLGRPSDRPSAALTRELNPTIPEDQSKCTSMATKRSTNPFLDDDELDELVKEEDDVAKKQMEAETEAARLAKAVVSSKAAEKEKERMEELANSHHQIEVKPLKPVDRRYATEDERVRAEADVKATQARMENIKFDFSFQ